MRSISSGWVRKSRPGWLPGAFVGSPTNGSGGNGYVPLSRRVAPAPVLPLPNVTKTGATRTRSTVSVNASPVPDALNTVRVPLASVTAQPVTSVPFTRLPCPPVNVIVV